MDERLMQLLREIQKWEGPLHDDQWRDTVLRKMQDKIRKAIGEVPRNV